MADPVHTRSCSTECVMHALLKCLVVKKVIGLSKAVIGNDIDGKSGVGAAHKHRFARVLMSLQSIRELIDGLPNQRFQSPH